MNIFLKPAVPKCWLFAASGGLWSLVGLTMCASGLGWLKQEGFARGVGFSLAGVLLAVCAVRWKFGDMAKKNIRRLRRLPVRGCLFAFQAWQSYAVILVMIFLGITLRHS
ncbi:MAG: hypothetical protein WBY88_05310, partial [Desulfosarcina sp.]